MSLFGGGKPRPRRRLPQQSRQDQRPRRVGPLEIVACGAVAVICVALISLIWINAERAIREQSDDARLRVETAVVTQAATLAAQVRHELLMIDQSLTVLQAEWDANPDTFKLADWRRMMPALTDVTDDLFVANDKQVIVQDVNPAAVGQGIGSAYATFGNGSLEPIQANGPHGADNAMLAGELGSAGVIRQSRMYMLRPLGKPPGWIIGASYQSGALATVFASAGLGLGGLAALVDTHGDVQAVAGTAAVRPRLNIGDTPMYAAMLGRPDGGIWAGRTSIDGAERVIGFRRVPGRDLLVLVGVARDQALGPAESWAVGVRVLAAMASLLILAIGATLLWELSHWRSIRRRSRALTQAQALLAAVQGDLAATRMQAAVGAAQSRAMLAGVSEGVAVIDGNHRLAAWNARFAAQSGLAEDVPREGMPLDELLRQRALAGRFGAPRDVEAEIARRIALLLPESGAGEVAETGPDGARLVLRAQRMPDGGLVLILRAANAPDAPALAQESATADRVGS
jgi:PAS domain-containing protein